MPALKLTAFSGEQPRIIPRLLPDTAAQSAFNTRLDDGGLSPYYEPSSVSSLSAPTASYLTIYKFGDTWLGFEDHVHLAEGPVAQNRLYYTGDGVPKMRVSSTVYPLALAAPSGALTGTPSGSGTGNVYTRIYVYTWVTGFGEESEPSPASAEVDWQAGQTVTLTGFASTPSGRNITHQRIYRSQTGSTGTDLYFIAERSASTSSYVDSIAVDAFEEVLPSRYWTPPVDTLSGLTAMPNGMMAAFSGKDLYFSEPWRPHAWPETYVLTTDTEIVALGAIGTSLAVLTKGHPYFVTGTTPESMTMDKIEANYPCINARGVIDLGYSIVYPSHEGLVAVKSNGSIGLISSNLFSPDEWRKLNPGTMCAGQLAGRWVASYNSVDDNSQAITGSILVDTSGSTAFLIRSDVYASAWYYDVEEGALYFVEPEAETIFRFDPPGGVRAKQYWRSKQFILGAPQNFAAILVDASGGLSSEEAAALDAEIAAIAAANEVLIAAGSISGDLASDMVGVVPVGGDILTPIPNAGASTIAVGVYADGVKVATISEANKVKRLPAGFKARQWEIDAFGDVDISQIAMATTVDELKAM